MKQFTVTDGYDRRKTPRTLTVRTLTLTEIKALHAGSHVKVLTLDGRSARDLKINGRIRTWARDLNRIEVPVKYGMYECWRMDTSEALSRLLVEVGE
jgi:hypothetical protein